MICLVEKQKSEAGTTGFPIEISSASDLTAALSDSANVGKIYKYTGTTTSNYRNGAIYIIEEDEI